MADEDDIRELIGRLSSAQRQGFHVTPAHIRLVVAALRFYAAARSWLAKPDDPHKAKPTDPHDDAAPRTEREVYTGPLPTIGDSRRQGMVACHIHCEGPNCWHQARFTFDQLGLPDETAFLDIVRLKGFRCGKCGCKRVNVSPDWRDVRAQGSGKRHVHYNRFE